MLRAYKRVRARFLGNPRRLAPLGIDYAAIISLHSISTKTSELLAKSTQFGGKT